MYQYRTGLGTVSSQILYMDISTNLVIFRDDKGRILSYIMGSSSDQRPKVLLEKGTSVQYVLPLTTSNNNNHNNTSTVIEREILLVIPNSNNQSTTFQIVPGETNFPVSSSTTWIPMYAIRDTDDSSGNGLRLRYRTGDSVNGLYQVIISSAGYTTEGIYDLKKIATWSWFSVHVGYSGVNIVVIQTLDPDYVYSHTTDIEKILYFDTKTKLCVFMDSVGGIYRYKLLGENKYEITNETFANRLVTEFTAQYSDLNFVGLTHIIDISPLENNIHLCFDPKYPSVVYVTYDNGVKWIERHVEGLEDATMLQLTQKKGLRWYNVQNDKLTTYSLPILHSSTKKTIRLYDNGSVLHNGDIQYNEDLDIENVPYAQISTDDSDSTLISPNGRFTLQKSLDGEYWTITKNICTEHELTIWYTDHELTARMVSSQPPVRQRSQLRLGTTSTTALLLIGTGCVLLVLMIFKIRKTRTYK